MADRLETRLHDEMGLFKEEPGGPVDADQPVVARQHWEPWFAALARSSKSALLAGESAGVQLVLRLFDEHEGRRDREFEASWRSFLQAWNLLQFHEKVLVYSSELLTTEFAEATTPLGGAQMAAEPAAEEWEVPGNPEVAELLRDSTERSRPLIRAVATANVPLPIYEFELGDREGRCGPEPELAWPAEKISVLAERQQEDRRTFEAAGWTVFVHPVPVDELVEELRRRVAGSAATEVES